MFSFKYLVSFSSNIILKFINVLFLKPGHDILGKKIIIATTYFLKNIRIILFEIEKKNRKKIPLLIMKFFLIG